MERIEKLVDSIKSEDPLGAEQLFKDELGDRIKVALTDRKTEVGKKLFSKTPEEPSQIDKLINPKE